MVTKKKKINYISKRIILTTNFIAIILLLEFKEQCMKESRKNFTFSIKPTVQTLLVKLSMRKDRSQGKILEELILEKARKLKIEN